MKYTIGLTLSAALAGGVAAQSTAPGTNAARMARGLPPAPPSRRWTPTSAARRTTPSATPLQCNTGPVQCCNSVTQSNDPIASLLIGLLGIVGVPSNVAVGITCSPLSAVGVGGNSCSQQPVCCENNSFNGVIAVGCTPINIHL